MNHRCRLLLVAIATHGCATVPGDDPGAEPRRDAGTQAAAIDPLPCQARLCDSFEEDVAGQQPSRDRWTPWGHEGGPASVVTTRAHSGAKALRMTSALGPSWRYFRTRAFTITNNAYYGRLYLFIAARPREFVHWNLISSFGDNENEIRYGAISEAHLHYLIYNVQPKQAREVAKADVMTYTFPTGRWVCLEWMFDGNNDEAQIWIDGFERTDLHMLGTYKGTEWAMANLRDVNIGWGIYQPITTPFEVFIDDVALDDRRIRCK